MFMVWAPVIMTCHSAIQQAGTQSRTHLFQVESSFASPLLCFSARTLLQVCTCNNPSTIEHHSSAAESRLWQHYCCALLLRLLLRLPPTSLPCRVVPGIF